MRHPGGKPGRSEMSSYWTTRYLYPERSPSARPICRSAGYRLLCEAQAPIERVFWEIEQRKAGSRPVGERGHKAILQTAKERAPALKKDTRILSHECHVSRSRLQASLQRRHHP